MPSAQDTARILQIEHCETRSKCRICFPVPVSETLTVVSVLFVSQELPWCATILVFTRYVPIAEKSGQPDRPVSLPQSRFTRKLSRTCCHPMPAAERFFFLFVILAAFHAGMAGSLLGQDDSGVEIIPAWSDQLNTPGYGYDGFGRSIVERGLAHSDELWFDFGGLVRSYFINDQRIEFTGLEATFGVEASMRGELGQTFGDMSTIVYGEVFLSQRFDQNILLDSPLRRLFAGNFDVEPFEISQLAVVAVRNDLEFEMGRFVTPFGRYYGLSWQNDFVDTPFLRSEIIHFRETGGVFFMESGHLRHHRGDYQRRVCKRIPIVPKPSSAVLE